MKKIIRLNQGDELEKFGKVEGKLIDLLAELEIIDVNEYGYWLSKDVTLVVEIIEEL